MTPDAVISKLEILLDSIAKMTALPIVSRFSSRDQNTFNVIQHVAQRWMRYIFLSFEFAISNDRSNAKPRNRAHLSAS